MVETRLGTRASSTCTTAVPASSSAPLVTSRPRRGTKRLRGTEEESEGFAEAMEELVDDNFVEGPSTKTRARKRRRAAVVEPEDEHDTQQILPDPSSSPSISEPTPKSKPKTARTPLVEGAAASTSKPPLQTTPKPKAPPKALTYDPSTFLPRIQSPWKVGAHVSAAGGVENAVVNAAMIGATAFALFLKPQRTWSSAPLSPSSIALFKERMTEFGYDAKHVLPHGSYLVNLGNPDEEKRSKSYACFLDDLQRAEALGLKYYNFHPGSTVGQTTREASIKHIAECLNKAHRVTEGVVTVLENMAGAGNVIGASFEDLRDIIALVDVKERVGVCLDTCHAYAAGYDISTKEGWEKTMTEFDEKVGLRYLVGMHLNDSKTPCGSRRDRHENLGMGTLGLPAFHAILTDPRTQDIPLILETPSAERPMEVWGVEVRVLNALSGVTHGPVPEEGGRGGEDGAMGTSESKKTVEELAVEVRTAVASVAAHQNAKGKVKGAKPKAVGKGTRAVKEEDEGEAECDCESKA